MAQNYWSTIIFRIFKFSWPIIKFVTILNFLAIKNYIKRGFLKNFIVMLFYKERGFCFMKKNFVKLASFMFALAMGCSLAMAERKLPMNEVKPANVSLPVITVPANQVKEKIEERVVTPAVDAKGEAVKTGKETNAPLSNIKNEGNILIKQQDGSKETSEIVPNNAPVVEKETTVEEKAGTIFDNYAVKENLKIKTTPQNK